MKQVISFGIFLSVLFLFSACPDPAYEMTYSASATQSGSTLTVSYSMNNVGRETLYNARIQITPYVDGSRLTARWTDQVNLSVGETASGTMTYSTGGTFTADGAGDYILITGAGWDKDDF